MDYSITAIQQHHYDAGRAAFNAGRDIDSHRMNPGSIAIAHFQRGWVDARKTEHAKLLAKPVAAGAPP